MGDIEKGFVEGKGLDHVCVAFEDSADAAAFLFVDVEAYGNDNEVGAALHGLEGGHGGAYAELAGLVVAGGKHAASGTVTTDGNRLVTEIGTVADFNGCVEAVHVDVNY